MKQQRKIMIIIVAFVLLAIWAFFVLKQKATSNSAKFESQKSITVSKKNSVQYLTKEEYIQKYMPDIASNSFLFHSAMNGVITSHNKNIVIV